MSATPATTADLPAIRLTYSESKQWLRDPRQWYLGTYRGLRLRGPEKAGGALSIGNGYHDALASYYADGLDPVAFIDQRADAMLAAQTNGEGVITDEYYRKDCEAERSLLKAMVGGYIDWLAETGADADLEIEGAEQFVEVDLVPGITLLSKLDAIVRRRSDGLRLALEHKTTGDLNQPLPLLKLDRQFLTEHLARFLMLRTQGATEDEAIHLCAGVLWNGAKKNKRTAAAKPPFYNRLDVPHNIHELRNHWRHMVAVGRQIQHARAALDAGANHHVICPPNPTKDSTWDDPFFRVSVMLDDGSNWEGALEEMYEVRDPLERYAGAERVGGPDASGTMPPAVEEREEN